MTKRKQPKATYKISYDESEDGFYLSTFKNGKWVDDECLYFTHHWECYDHLERCIAISKTPQFFDESGEQVEGP